MKVAYNNCFGGFGLSPLATTEFAKKKGITLTWYKQVGYRHEGNEKHVKVDGIPDDNGMSISAATEDLGDEITSIPNEAYYSPSFSENESRCDPDLIEVIERLGDKADGLYASLAIKEVPDGASFEVTKYDGSEGVVPPRMSW